MSETTTTANPKLELAHEILMQEENLKTTDLPVQIRKSINAFNMQKKKFDKKFTEKMYKNLQELTVDIAEKIQNWTERDLPEETEEPAAQESPASEPPPPPVETPEEKAQKIADAIKAAAVKGEIKKDKLLEILGRAPLEVEIFANVKVAKLAFSKNFVVYNR